MKQYAHNNFSAAPYMYVCVYTTVTRAKMKSKSHRSANKHKNSNSTNPVVQVFNVICMLTLNHKKESNCSYNYSMLV